MHGLSLADALRFAIVAGASLCGLLVSFLCLRFARAAAFAQLRWFALFSLAVSAYCVCTLGAIVPDPVWTVRGALGVFVTSNVALTALLGYASQVLGARPSRLQWACYAATLLTGFISIIPHAAFSGETRSHEVAWLGLTYYDAVPTPFGRVSMGLSLLTLSYLAVLHVRAVRRRLPGAGFQLACLLLITLGGLCDTLSLTHVIALPYVLPATFLVVVIVFGIGLTARFVHAATELDRLSNHLEDQVKRRTSELISARAQLLETEKMAALGRVAAGVAHEVNNPAVAVLFNLEHMLAEHNAGRFGLHEEVRECLLDSREGILRIAGLVRQLLDAGRVASQRALEPVRLRPVIERAIKSARARAEGRVQLASDVGDDVWVLGQAQVLEQVVLNLVVNGVQALPPERADGRVVVSAGEEGDRVAIRVEDNGCGIPPDLQRQVFEPFFTTKPLGQGTGLGLAVSLGIVRSLGGELTLESQVGAGTRFHVLLAPASAA